MFATATLVARVANVARAAEETSPSARVTPPQFLDGPIAEYPENASGDATIVVRVTVDAHGKVSDVQIDSGNAPFVDATRQAVKNYSFVPAQKDGHPIPAKILMEVRFYAPPVVEHQDSIEQPIPSTSVPPTDRPIHSTKYANTQSSSVRPLEVVVQGERVAPAVSSFTRTEVRQLPGAFGDPFRAIEAMPGVTPIASGIPFFYVRGAPPGNVGYYFDGVRVPYLFHLAIGPSVIHPGMVERVNLYPGGYPAHLGRFAGGIVSAEATKPLERPHGEGNLRLFDAGALAETGFADGRGTVLLAGRYSYTAALLSAIAPEVDLDYRDFQTRVTYSPSAKSELSWFTFGAFDLLGQRKDSNYRVLFGTEFYRSNFKYTRHLDGDALVSADLSLGFDRSHIGSQRNARSRMIQPRFEFRRKMTPTLRFRSGADVLVEVNDADRQPLVDHDDPQVQRYERLFRYRTDLTSGIWVELSWRATPRIEIIPGLRVDVFHSGTTTIPAIDPRIAAEIRISDRLRLLHAYGLVHQPPSFILPIPGMTPGNLENGLQSSIQTSAGLEFDIDDATTTSLQAFHNAYFKMTDAMGALGEFDERGNGSAVGAELSLRRRFTRQFSGFASYTLSRSVRRINEESVLSTMDRTHTGNLALSVDLGRKWRTGGRLVAYSGLPKIETIDDSTTDFSSPSRTKRFGREPMFYRLDLRLEKRWTFGNHGYLAFVVELMNATMQKETFFGERIGPITIPSLGLEGGY